MPDIVNKVLAGILAGITTVYRTFLYILYYCLSFKKIL